MSAPGQGFSTFQASLTAATLAGSKVTFTHGVGKVAKVVIVSDRVTGRILEEYEVEIAQTVNALSVSNLASGAVAVNVEALWQYTSSQNNSIPAGDPRLTFGAGPSGSGGPVSGSGAASEVAFWTAPHNLAGDPALEWDNTTKQLSVGALGGKVPEGQVDSRGASGPAVYMKVGPSNTDFSAQVQADLVAATPSNLFAGIDVTGGGVGPLNALHEVTTDRSLGGTYPVVSVQGGMATSNPALSHVGQAFGAEFYTYHTGAGVVDDADAVVGTVYNANVGTISLAAALTAGSNVNSGGGIITRNVGARLQNQAGVAALATNNFQLYSETINPTVIRSDGFVGIGSDAPNAALDVAVGSLATRALTPATFGVSQNNFNTGDTSFARLAATAGGTAITGFTGGANGLRKVIANVGANAFNLNNLDAGSGASNQIITGTGAAVAVAVNQTRELIYDATTAKWRLIG